MCSKFEVLLERLNRIIDLNQEIVGLLKSIDRKTPNHYTIRVKQIKEKHMATNIQVGGSASFEAELLSNGSPIALPAGSKWAWSSPDGLITFDPLLEADGTTVDPNGITVNVAGSDTQTSAVIVAGTTDPDGKPVSGEVTVPVTPEPQVFTVRITEN